MAGWGAPAGRATVLPGCLSQRRSQQPLISLLWQAQGHRIESRDFGRGLAGASTSLPQLNELTRRYASVEEVLSGHTTNVDDPTDPRFNGASYLPAALASHLPLDLFIILLGNNDTKVYFHRNPFEIAAGVSVLISQVVKSMGTSARRTLPPWCC